MAQVPRMGLSVWLLLACGPPGAAAEAAAAGGARTSAAFFLQYDGRLIPAGGGGLLQSRRAGRRGRLEALLEGRASLPGVRFHVSERLRGPFLSEAPGYVFGATTGHTGSTSLSSRDGYAPGPRRDAITFHFEDLFQEELAWQEWWHGRKRSLHEQIHRVARRYKPGVDRAMAAARARTYVDLGHHNIHGILGATPEVFGAEAFLVRVRRERLRVAYSFSLSPPFRDLCPSDGRSLASAGAHGFAFRLCPLTNEVLLHPAGGNWTRSSWSSLSLVQQALWYIDELEAEWQRLLASYPDASYLECDWVDELRPCFEAVAAVLGLDVSDQEVHLRNHTSKITDQDDPFNVTSLSREDRQYRGVMGFGN
mmetsp:Transcript_13687/g.38884  ORF Transcript_13687/g.38884 Transcript_13687/m.38884 type:complete len:366 (-) Transcript_13687:55-1152(-)